MYGHPETCACTFARGTLVLSYCLSYGKFFVLLSLLLRCLTCAAFTAYSFFRASGRRQAPTSRSTREQMGKVPFAIHKTARQDREQQQANLRRAMRPVVRWFEISVYSARCVACKHARSFYRVARRGKIQEALWC